MAVASTAAGMVMSEGPEPIEPEAITVRSFRPSDQPTVSCLYTDGLLAGQIPPSDTGADIENIQAGYLANERNHFWIAEHDGQPVGMIGVAEDEPNIAEIRRLRVDPEYKGLEAVPEKLLERALQFCRHHGYLKVVLDTRVEPGPAKALFERFGFNHHRTRSVQDKELLEFYLDLYQQP